MSVSMDALTRFSGTLARYGRDDDGASAAEYALTLIILSGCTIVVLHSLGTKMDATLTRLANLIPH